jgi:hypothetical protein
MRSILEQLDNDEAVLLVYLADELPAVQRAEVEKRLATDPMLAAQLRELQETHEMISRAVREAPDAGAAAGAGPVPTTAAATERKLVRMIRQWGAQRVLDYSTSRATRPRQSRWWIYAAAAAVLFVGFIIWWGVQDNPARFVQTTGGTSPESGPEGGPAGGGAQFEQPLYAQGIVPYELAPDTSGLLSANEELRALQSLRLETYDEERLW